MRKQKNLRATKLDVNREKRAKKRERESKKRFPIFQVLFVLLILVGVYFGGAFLYKNGIDLLNTKTQQIFYTPNQTTESITLKNTFYFTTIDGLKSINLSGKDINNDANASISPFIRGMKEPIFVKSKDTILAFDIMGKSALLFNETGVIVPYNFDKEIINARMNSKGQFVFILNEDGSKAAVKAYDTNGNELLTWFSGTGYVVDAVINDTKNMMAVVTNDIVGGAITSKLLFFQLDVPDPVVGKVIGDKMCSYVSYTGNTALIVCDNGVFAVGDSGTLSPVMDFSGKKVKSFRSFTNGDLMICYENAGSEMYDVEIYSAKGKKISQFTMDSFNEITDISRDKFLVSKRKEVMSIDKKGKILKIIPSEIEVKEASYFKNKIAIIGHDRMFFN